MRALLLLVVVLLVSPAVAEERAWRLGVLNPGGWAESSLSQVMVPELARRDVVEGRNLIVLPYWGSGSDPAALGRAARTLAASDPDVVVAVSTEAVEAARVASPRTSIVAAFEEFRKRRRREEPVAARWHGHQHCHAGDRGRRKACGGATRCNPRGAQDRPAHRQDTPIQHCRQREPCHSQPRGRDHQLRGAEQGRVPQGVRRDA